MPFTDHFEGFICQRELDLIKARLKVIVPVIDGRKITNLSSVRHLLRCMAQHEFNFFSTERCGK
jgi:hypothetical protein